MTDSLADWLIEHGPFAAGQAIASMPPLTAQNVNDLRNELIRLRSAAEQGLVRAVQVGQLREDIQRMRSMRMATPARCGARGWSGGSECILIPDHVGGHKWGTPQ